MHVCKLSMGLEKNFCQNYKAIGPIPSSRPSDSPLWLVSVRGLCYEYQFSFSLKFEVIAIKKIALKLDLKERRRGTRKLSIASWFAYVRQVMVARGRFLSTREE